MFIHWIVGKYFWCFNSSPLQANFCPLLFQSFPLTQSKPESYPSRWLRKKISPLTLLLSRQVVHICIILSTFTALQQLCFFGFSSSNSGLLTFLPMIVVVCTASNSTSWWHESVFISWRLFLMFQLLQQSFAHKLCSRIAHLCAVLEYFLFAFREWIMQVKLQYRKSPRFACSKNYKRLLLLK